MKNLQNFGVQELNFKEIKETEGGLFGLPWFGYGNLFSVFNPAGESFYEGDGLSKAPDFNLSA